MLRTGFEDSIHLPNGDVAGTNARLVEALVKIVRTLGREIASPAEAREILSLGLTGGRQVMAKADSEGLAKSLESFGRVRTHRLSGIPDHRDGHSSPAPA